MEEMARSLGDRQANLLIKMSPPIVTTELIQKQGQQPVIEFKTCNSKTNQTFKEPVPIKILGYYDEIGNITYLNPSYIISILSGFIFKTSCSILKHGLI
jgi:hypothetical protein